MAKQSVFGTSVMGPDESAVGTIGNIAEMFNPENQAKGMMAKAHANYYNQHAAQAEAGAAQSAAKTELLKMQAAALNPQKLVEIYGPEVAQAVMAAGGGNDPSKTLDALHKMTVIKLAQTGNPQDLRTAAVLNKTPGSTATQSVFSNEEGINYTNQNNESKLAQLVAEGQLRNQGLLNRGIVVPSGGMLVRGSGQPAPTAPVFSGVSPADLVLGGNPMPSSAFGGSTQQLAQPGTINSFIPGNGANPSSAPGLPAGAILNPKPAKVDKGMSPSQVNAVDTRMRNGIGVLDDTVSGLLPAGSQTLNRGDANAIVTAATTKYPNLPVHQAIPQLIKDQNIQFNERPFEWLDPSTWTFGIGHNAIVPTAGGKPVQQGLADVITGGQSAPAVNAPAVTTQATPDVITTVPAIADRVVGEVYTTPKGPLKWSGTGWGSP